MPYNPSGGYPNHLDIYSSLKQGFILTTASQYGGPFYPDENYITFSNGGTLSSVLKNGNGNLSMAAYDVTNAGEGTVTMYNYGNTHAVWIIGSGKLTNVSSIVAANSLTVPSHVSKGLLVTSSAQYGGPFYPDQNAIAFSNGGQIDKKLLYIGNDGLTMTIYEVSNVGVGNITCPAYGNTTYMWALFRFS